MTRFKKKNTKKSHNKHKNAISSLERRGYRTRAPSARVSKSLEVFRRDMEKGKGRYTPEESRATNTYPYAVGYNRVLGGKSRTGKGGGIAGHRRMGRGKIKQVAVSSEQEESERN